MAFEAMAWAVKQETANSGQKLVLLLLANHTNGHTGQCNPSQKLLAAECSMGLSTLRRHLIELQEAGFISMVHQYADNMKRPSQYIVHFKTSLDVLDQLWTNDHPNRMDPPSKSDGPLPPNRMIETGNINSNRNNTIVPQDDERFNTFWNAYPRKTNKGYAKQVFKKLRVDKELLDKMVLAIGQQKQSEQWKNPQYIPHPSTWLNGERWEDELTTTAKPLSPAEREKQRLFGR